MIPARCSPGRAALWAALLLACACLARASSVAYSPALPVVGDRSLLILSPTILEITAITAGGPSAPPEKGPPPQFPPPELNPADFTVTVAGAKRPVVATGFRRRPVYAPLKQRDLRIGNYIYLRLAEPIKEGETVEIAHAHRDKIPWLADARLAAKADPRRLSPALHVNQVGYAPDAAKIATVGYYLGSLGELALDTEPPKETRPAESASTSPANTPAGPLAFHLADARTEKIVHRGELSPRPARLMPYRWYQKVWEADFTAFKTPGEYRLVVPGLGASYPFFIDEGVPATFARTYALGLYHQRCGADNALPFTRFVHGPCHTAHATVPSAPIRTLKGLEETEPDANLFPFIRSGKVDVTGGHHDAGDYSKYTTNSAALVHHLIFAVDSFAGVAAIDNLGLPESGDGISDLLQIAKWESDFLAKMQDADGGFYFLVYPRDRRYEDNVLPDKGDPQIVWPKNSAATAAAVAALTQTASSPHFKKHFPKDAERYLAAARKGWNFLLQAQLKHSGGIYRKFTHYGDLFKDEDEMLWAAVELYLATGDSDAADEIKARLNPRHPGLRRWGWRRMSESYGNAIRSYAFAVRSGRVDKEKIDPRLVARCEDEIVACAEDWARASRDSGHGASYPEQTKQVIGGGWFFPFDQAFDLAVACQLEFPAKADRRPTFHNAVLANLNYEAGSNPVNVSFLTGVGWKRPLDIVHQYSQNDHRTLPLSGIPIGSIQTGFYYMPYYRTELGALCYPLDGAKDSPYPILDRWGDSFNLETEFVILNQARGLAVTAWLLAQSPLRAQSWKPAVGKIEGAPQTAATNQPVKLRFAPPAGLDLARARVVWDARDQAPAYGPDFTFTPKSAGEQWIEVEAHWPDGRRVYAVAKFPATASTTAATTP